MADNVVLDPGTDGATIKTDDDGTAHWQYVKIAFGVDNTQTRVTSSSGLPVLLLAGTAEIGKLAAGTAEIGNVTNSGTFAVQSTLQANSGVDIGDVDVTSVIPGTAASNLGKAEDAAHTSGDVGVMALAVRNDTLAALAGADGDYSALQVNGDGALYVRSAGHVSTVNSSSAPLGISEVFAGTAEEITHYSSVAVSVFADEDSATGGLSLQFSTNGTNWDNTEGHDVLADTHHFVGGMGESKWFRIVYTNGTTEQTVFRLQTVLRNAPLSGEVEPLDHDITGSEDAMLVRSVLSAQKPDTSYTNISATSGGNLKVAIEEADTSASGLAKAEDAVHSSGDTGVMALGVRSDSLSSLAGTDGDYVPPQFNVDGALWTHHAPNEVDSNNSTTTPLGISATFAGTAVSLLDSAAVSIMLDSSHDSATDGMQFQFSTDGTNWDTTHDFTYTAANGGREFQFGTVGRYFRVVFTNGTTEQTHLRIQTILLHSDPITTIHRIGDDVSPDRSATIQKTCIIAQQGGGGPGAGDFIPVQATAGGNLRMSVEEFDTSLPAGTNNIGDVDVLTLPGIVGSVAHDAVDSGSPVKTGAKAKNFDGSAPGAPVAEDDRVDHIADVYGRQFVETAHPNSWDVSVDYAVAQTNTTIKAAPGAGLSLYLTDVFLSNGATAGNVTLLDGSGGTVKWEDYPAITGGAKDSRRTPIKLTANTLLAITSTTVTTHSLTISGYIAP